jgi:Fe2+ or Zn2+ uptake regulation protein
MDPRPEPARRTTRQLTLVLETVQTSGTLHPSAEQVFAQVRRRLPRISLGTVYRNLTRLAAEGRIGVLHADGRAARFDPKPGAHDHFVCRACGRVDDLGPTRPAEGWQAARRRGHDVTAHALVLYGCCRFCRTGTVP